MYYICRINISFVLRNIYLLLLLLLQNRIPRMCYKQRRGCRVVLALQGVGQSPALRTRMIQAWHGQGLFVKNGSNH